MEHSGRVNSCPLCSLPLLVGERQVRVAGGGQAHILCADIAALAVDQRRRRAALFHALLVALVALLATLTISPQAGILLLLAGLAPHFWWHRLWWRRQRTLARRWLAHLQVGRWRY